MIDWQCIRPIIDVIGYIYGNEASDLVIDNEPNAKVITYGHHNNAHCYCVVLYLNFFGDLFEMNCVQPQTAFTLPRISCFSHAKESVIPPSLPKQEHAVARNPQIPQMGVPLHLALPSRHHPNPLPTR
mmetsp:Transcript_24549/g.52893  ORF Transcript_24549/g.52893 Transcript_24549/m.52893 type:complete len:128 (-) Transcript_24549:428-811(-)